MNNHLKEIIIAYFNGGNVNTSTPVTLESNLKVIRTFYEETKNSTPAPQGQVFSPTDDSRNSSK